MKQPTQLDVAKLAGVSRATVSYVLSGRSGGAISVSTETRKRVLKAADDLGYEPNATARSLRLSTTYNIGITIPDMKNPHMQEILCGAAHAAQACDYNLLLFSTDLKPENEILSLRELASRRIDGLIILPTFVNVLQKEFEVFSEKRSPIVITGNYYNEICGLDCVIPSHDIGAAQMMKHLISLGHKDIGFILGVSRKPLASERLTAYYQSLKSQGWEINPEHIIETSTTYMHGFQAAQQLLLLDPRPTAILCINDLLAVGAMYAIHQQGLHIPEDISIAGFDNIEISSFIHPPLTTVDVNARTIGEKSLKLVLDRIENPEKQYEQIRIPAQLIIRSSTGPVNKTIHRVMSKSLES
jgi:LacI family transcriptional regulator